MLKLHDLGFPSKFAALPPVLTLVALWLALHGYHGITDDGQIYAFQAFSRLDPELKADLYLQYASQDQFTVFSPLYAWCIALLGLENAARLLTLVFTVWFVAAAWSFARAAAGRDMAWLATAFLLIVGGDYGGSGVFRILDPFLTARLPAEALTITALVCHFRGMRRLALVLSFAALSIHPLLALPGLLLIVCLRLPLRLGAMGAIGGVLVTFGIAIAATRLPTVSPVLTVMDAPWLEVVEERSQFLFLQLWSIRDWNLNLRAFICLGFTAIAVTDERTRKLCLAAALVGVAGLAVAFIGGLVGPLAVVVQGQAWRWVWVTVFISVVLVPVTAVRVWRDEKCGPLCALLLLSGWTLPADAGTGCVSLALMLWSVRARLGSRFVTYLQWGCAALGAAIVLWTSSKSWEIISPPPPSGPVSAVQGHDTIAWRVPALLLVAATWWGTRVGRTAWTPICLSALLAALSLLIFPAAFKQNRTLGSGADIHEFADWRNAIPPSSTVLVAPARDVGAFVWFTLGRPNYLALDQSAGVVFSRATALEVRRRSENLLPLMDPNWKIMSGLKAASGRGHKNAATTRPLTRENLIRVCADPQLGFVISRGNVGFDPMPHEHAGDWRDWYLYDCRKVRSVPSTT
jgi:hypothetical protein